MTTSSNMPIYEDPFTGDRYIVVKPGSKTSVVRNLKSGVAFSWGNGLLDDLVRIDDHINLQKED